MIESLVLETRRCHSWRFGFEMRNNMSGATVKQEARKLVEKLPDDATWEDLQYEIYVRQAIEAGLKDFQEGHTVAVDEVERELD